MNELFPLGSLVTIKGVKEVVMIMGYLHQANGHLYDYIGVPYPAGLVSSKSMIVFDHSSLDLLVSKGYEDKESKTFLNTLPSLVSKVAALAEDGKGGQ